MKTTTNAATLLNILQAVTYAFLQGLSTVEADAMTAEDVTLTREDWETFLGSPRGTERIVVDHRDLHTYRLVIQ